MANGNSNPSATRTGLLEEYRATKQAIRYLNSARIRTSSVAHDRDMHRARLADLRGEIRFLDA